MKPTMLIASLMVLLLAACSSTPTPTPPATVLPPPAAISVSGKVMPAQWATLSFQSGGRVTAVNVQVGAQVKAGDVLVQLDDSEAKFVVAQAQATLAMARAQRDGLIAGPRAQELQAARTAISMTQATLAGAQANLNQVNAGATAAEVTAAEAALAETQAARLAAWKAHQQTMKCVDITLPTGRQETICPALGTYEEQARANLAAADQAVAAAQAQLDRLQKGATGDELNAARARVAAAQAQVAQAQAQFELLQAGASQEQIAVADAGVRQAQAAVEAAQTQLAKLQLVAPFDGIVGTVFVRPGEQPLAGNPAVIMGDVSTLRVETTDLSEVDVARVHIGQAVQVSLDALPGVTLAGKVVRIAPMATPGQSSVNYIVIVELDRLDPALRWGMTAFVDIQI